MSLQKKRFERRLKKKEEKKKRYDLTEYERSAKFLENEVMTLMIGNLHQMHSNFIRWKTKSSQFFKDNFTDEFSIWAHWLHYDNEIYIRDFEGIPINSERGKHITPIHSIMTAEQFWSICDPYYEIIPLVWRIRFTQSARLQLVKMSLENKEYVLRRCINFATGYISTSKIQDEISCKQLKIGPCTHMAFYSSWINDGIFLIFCVEMNRYPYISNKKIVYYSLEQHLKVIGFVPRSHESEAFIQSYINQIEKHPDMYIEKEETEYDFSLFNDNESVMRQVGNLNFPVLPSKVYLTNEEAESMVFNIKLKRWVRQDNGVLKTEYNLKSQGIIRQLATEEAGTNFVKLLTTIPNFKIKLTDEQNETVSSQGNIVILGRSGTGKTTCAVLRMFASELLFKFIQPRSQRHFGPEDVGRTSVLHTAFVTASPVLTNEVKRFYNKLNEHVKAELTKKIKNKREKEFGVIDIEADEIKENDEYSSDSEDDSGPVSMNFIKDEDFPLFYTVRRLIFMIDASLRRPFFARDINGKVIGAGTNFEWHNEYKGSLKISKDYKMHVRRNHQLSDSDESDEEALEKQLETEILMKMYEEDRRKKFMSRTFEVDYKIFKDKFWPKIKMKCRHSALVLWTEITAYIKGSSTSHMYPGYYLPNIVYANKGRKQSLLSREEKLEIWELFIEYEKWKVSCRAYDFQDIVNYILSQIKYHGYIGIPIHYMMVDEVQDLTPATITLLIHVTKEKLMFSGDTAQTIAKGVGFRFCDLETLFYDSELAKPKIYQLTMNFRTHNQILAMANSIVALLETLFPQTIDKMAKETSMIDGPRPKIISSSDHLHLFNVLFGFEKTQSVSQAQFGCNQVIIVRSQETKEKLHPLLSHALCLTVFEAKGLEFDDVVLYNFFTDSEVSNEKWKILSNIKRMDSFTSYKPKNFEDLTKAVPKLKCMSNFDQSKLSLLCTELKNLYVAITRPKKNLIIFDENPDKRRFMEEFWKYMDTVDIIDENDFCGEKKVEKDFMAIAQKTSGDAWRIQGERMMSHKFYDQAAKCFSVSGDKFLESKALAFAKANTASMIMIQAEALSDDINYYKKSKKAKMEIKNSRLQGESMFKKAAHELLELSKVEGSKSMLKQAAQCFASGKDFLQAGKIYDEMNFKGQAAESYSACGHYERAADLFNEKGEYVRAIECYSLCQQWDKLIHCLNKYKSLIPSEERKKYVYKYIPVALEALMPKILPNEQGIFIKKVVDEQKNIISEVNDSDEEDDTPATTFNKL
ncbi:hypothetical protein SteCoe_15847 [Stentor coeruleus]|uniref:Uncharacterized protein n=1 Tax=Stentor coeruleus TaxID=5963 RepID=A0A1R2C2S6_9CILI|nr:hypothetical protein SteCoe_15847 [Stentor coeruleus]